MAVKLHVSCEIELDPILLRRGFPSDETGRVLGDLHVVGVEVDFTVLCGYNQLLRLFEHVLAIDLDFSDHTVGSDLDDFAGRLDFIPVHSHFLERGDRLIVQRYG